jgi:hypothetical protein
MRGWFPACVGHTTRVPAAAATPLGHQCSMAQPQDHNARMLRPQLLAQLRGSLQHLQERAAACCWPHHVSTGGGAFMCLCVDPGRVCRDAGVPSSIHLARGWSTQATAGSVVYPPCPVAFSLTLASHCTAHHPPPHVITKTHASKMTVHRTRAIRTDTTPPPPGPPPNPKHTVTPDAVPSIRRNSSASIA